MANRKLSPELVSLVHHVELNKSGWWDKGVQQLIEAVLWLSGEPLSVDAAIAQVRASFHVDLEHQRALEQSREMASAGTVVQLQDGRLKLSEHALGELEGRIQEGERIEEGARRKFIEAFRDCCPDLSADEGWESFSTNMLLPLVREMGARTYELVSGSSIALEATASFPVFLAKYSPDNMQAVRNAVVKFLDPKDTDVRSYILRHLTSYFFIEAGNLDSKTIDALARVTKHPPSFSVFVDTNFLFSFLGLHENPSNEAAKSLMDLTSHLAGKLSCKFYVSPRTLDETKRVIGFHRDHLQNLRITPNVGAAALASDLSGITRRFVESAVKAGRPIKADDYFGPYLSDLIPALRAKNVELYNEPMDALGTKQEVIDDLLAQLEFEKRRYIDKAKTYEQLEHDMVLWHFVKSKRPARVESPVEATYWIATVDYHFLTFDLFKHRNAQNQIRVCLHPTSLIQMLQFWLPRTPEFEKAVLGSLRWPFLFQAFDPSAERVTIRILEALARFENVEELSTDVVASVLMNDALREKMGAEGEIKKQTELVREALVEENSRARALLKSTSEEAAGLKTHLEAERQERAALARLLEEERSKSEKDARDLSTERSARQDLQMRLERLEGSRDRRLFAMTWTAILVAVLSLASLGLYWLRPQVGFWRAGSVVWTGVLLLWVWLAFRRGEANPAVRKWHYYKQFEHAKKWLFGSVALILAWRFFEMVGQTAIDWVMPHLKR